MNRPSAIPSSVSRDQLKTWIRKRTPYINRFQISNWYPNCCLQARIDLSAADALRRKLNQEDPDPSQRITFSHIIGKAAANALRNHILFNGKYTRRDSLLVYQRIHLANVVDTGGMATRIVIDDADCKTLRQLASETHRLVSARRATLEENLDHFTRLQESIKIIDTLVWALPLLNRVRRDLSHRVSVDFLFDNPSSIVLTNPGTLGVQDCKAMLFFGQLLTCLRVMAIEEEAVLDQGQVHFRKVLPVGLDYDQRVMDAGPANRFLLELCRNLEQPDPYALGPAVEDKDAPMSWPVGAP